MKWPTQYEPLKHTFTEAGDPIYIDYVGRYNEKGEVELVEVGKHNIYDEIQSHLESTCIQTLIDRFERGETDVLSKMQGVFADVTNLPKSYADMLNLVNDAEMYFNSLPLEVREKFGHSFEKFMVSFGTEDFYAKVGAVIKGDDPIPDPVDGGVVSEQERAE